MRVDQLKFNKSCTSFIGDLKKSVKIPKLSQSIPHLTQTKTTKFVIKKKKEEKEKIIYELDLKFLAIFASM